MIVLRVDGDHLKGMGHLFRMMVLAEEFENRGQECLFVLREDNVSRGLLKERGCRFLMIDEGEDERAFIEKTFGSSGAIGLWIYDIFGTRLEWVLHIKEQGIPVVSFDDPGPGAAAADLVINPIIGCWKEQLERSGVINDPRYTLLPRRMKNMARYNQRGDTPMLGVSMGGSDTWGVSLDLARLLAGYKALKTILFLGPHFADSDEVIKVQAMTPETMEVRKNVPDLIADLAQVHGVICSGGQTMFECAALGLPALAIANEPHEEQTIEYFAGHGAVVAGGTKDQWDAQIITGFITGLAAGAEEVLALGKKGAALIDCEGAGRCVDACLGLLAEARSPC